MHSAPKLARDRGSSVPSRSPTGFREVICAPLRAARRGPSPAWLVSLRLLGVGSSAGLRTAPTLGADWQSGRRRPGNGSGFSGGRDPPEEAAAAARAARGERRERRAAAADAERAHRRSSARPPELRRGGCLSVPGPAWRLLSGLAGAGREPPGLSVPERCECSLASKVWSRQRQAPVLSSEAAQIRGQLRRHVLAVLRSRARVKPRNLGAGCDPRDHSLFGVFLRAHRLLHPDPLWAPAQHQAQRSAAIQGNRRAERLWELRQPGKWVPWKDAGRRIPERRARVKRFGGAPCQSLAVLVMEEWMNADGWLWGSSFSTSIQMLTSASAAGTPFLSDSGGHSPAYWARSFELRAGAPWGRLPVAQPIGGGSGRASLGCLDSGSSSLVLHRPLGEVLSWQETAGVCQATSSKGWRCLGDTFREAVALVWDSGAGRPSPATAVGAGGIAALLGLGGELDRLFLVPLAAPTAAAPRC